MVARDRGEGKDQKARQQRDGRRHQVRRADLHLGEGKADRQDHKGLDQHDGLRARQLRAHQPDRTQRHHRDDHGRHQDAQQQFRPHLQQHFGGQSLVDAGCNDEADFGRRSGIGARHAGQQQRCGKPQARRADGQRRADPRGRMRQAARQGHLPQRGRDADRRQRQKRRRQHVAMVDPPARHRGLAGQQDRRGQGERQAIADQPPVGARFGTGVPQDHHPPQHRQERQHL